VEMLLKKRSSLPGKEKLSEFERTLTELSFTSDGPFVVIVL
jgi:hypothetical protein